MVTGGRFGLTGKAASSVAVLLVGLGTGKEVTCTWKATVAEPPAGIVPTGIPVPGLLSLGTPLMVTLPGTKVVQLGTISVSIALFAGTVPVLFMATV